MKKFISVVTAFTMMITLSGLFTPSAVQGATFADGDLVREVDEFDVYIVKLVGAKMFKRLILNPDVFNMYGHLNWGDIQVVADGSLDSYATSELVRATGDEKVYKLFPDGDTGTKKWVDTLDCFNTQGFDWDSVYIINTFDRDSYTTASTTMCGTGEVVVGDINLSLASSTPAASTLPKNAYGVTFATINVSGTGTISQLVVKRSGAGATTDFANVYLFENGKRLTSGRTISSSTSKVTFIGLDIAAPTTLEIVADLDATAGNVNYFAIESASDITANANIGGSFPIAGNAMGISGTDAGTLTVVRSGSTAYNVTVGEKDVEVSQFKVTANVEGTNIERVQLYNSGSINSGNIKNVELKVGTETVATATAFGSDGYASFVLNTPYYIKKGSSATFKVFADIDGGKPDEDIKLYLELQTDILGIGTTYGYGMQATVTGYASGTLVTATLKGGDLTIIKQGPNAGNIARTTDDTVFLEYTMSSAADITIARTRLYWCADINGNGTWTAPSTNFTDVEDVKIINKDTGVVWAGPNDGSAFVTATDWAPCPGSLEGIYDDFTDTFDLSAGESYTLQVMGDVKYDNTAHATAQLVADSVIKLGLYSYASLVGTSGTSNYMKYTGTTNAVDDSAIVPSSDILGEEMTIKTPALAIALAGIPSGTDDSGAIGSARTFVKGQSDVDAAGFVFTAGVASDATVTDITLTSYVDCDADGTYVAGKEDSNCYAKNLISSVEIIDQSTGLVVPGSTSKGFGGTNYSTVTFSGLDWIIPAGEARTLLVRALVSSIEPSTSFDMVSFDIATADDDVTSQDSENTDVTETGDAANGGTNASVAVAIYPYGSIAVAKANDTPKQSVLLMGSVDNEVSKIKLTGTREGFNVEKFSLDIDAAADGTNFPGVALKYQTEAQFGSSNWTVSTKKTFTTEATLSFDFTGDAMPYVPKDDDSFITVLVDVLDYEAGTGADSGDYTWFAPATDNANEIVVYGAKSGKKIVTATEPTQTDFSFHYIFRARPVFAKKAWSGDANELARFTITAEGYDITFDGTDSADDGFYNEDDTVVSAGLEFDVIASGTDDTTQIITLYDWNNDAVSSVSGLKLSSADLVTENADAGFTTTVSFHFEEASSAVIIPEGTTKEFYIMIDNGVDFNNQDEYIQLKLFQNAGVAGGATTDNCSIVFYDGTDDEGTTFEHAICMPANTSGLGDFPMSFRLLQGSAQ